MRDILKLLNDRSAGDLVELTDDEFVAVTAAFFVVFVSM